MECNTLPRFTLVGESYDRWYCLGCCAVMYIKHGDEPPSPHAWGKDIEPPEGVMPGKWTRAPLAPSEPPLIVLTKSLPGDVTSIIEAGKKT